MSQSNDIFGVDADGKRTIQLSPDNEPQAANYDAAGRISSIDPTLSSGDVYRQTINRDENGKYLNRTRWVLQA